MENNVQCGPSKRISGRLLVTGIALLFLIPCVLVLVFGLGRTDRGDMKRMGTISEMRSIAAALNVYRDDTGEYPATEQGLTALVTCPPGVAGWHGKYIDEVPVDKWGHPFGYTCPVDRDATKYEIVSAGVDGEFGTEDDIEVGTRK